MAKRKSDKHKLRAFFQEALGGRRTVLPACRHFGVCGGCEFQDVPYPEQVGAKRAAFDFVARTVVGDFRERDGAGHADRLERLLSGAEAIAAPSPLQYDYRQRMDYVHAFGMAGLRQANSHRRVVELEECPLLGEGGFSVMRKARRLAGEAGLDSYDYLRHTGELRYFVVRRSRNGQILLSLVTKGRDAGDRVMGVLERLAADGDIASGHWLLAEGLGDTSFGPSLAHVGQPWIAEELNGVRLRLGPNTFFQANPAVAEAAYAAIRDFCPAGGLVLDLYSGVASIALSLAPAAGRVTAVENVPDNVALAHLNREDNRAENVDLVEADSAQFLRDLAGGPAEARPDLLVVNPPRPGVEGTGMADIGALGPKRLAYLSCNPFSLLRNLSELPGDYVLRSLTVYDMFPQTRHFETLALLERG